VCRQTFTTLALIFISSLTIGCSNLGKLCPTSGCGGGLKCEQMTNICQAKCAKPTDCGQYLTCDEEVNTCYDPMNPVVRKKLEAKAEAELEAKAEAERKAKCIADGRCVDFIKIPGGSFKMGSNDGDEYEKPVHRVHVKSFYMSKTEVTVGQYRACVQAGVCSTDELNENGIAWKSSKYCNWNESGRENHPINCVDWNQARRFAKWAGGDLPSEAQWEYAARGGQGNRYKYAGSNDADEIAWFTENTNNLGTRPVGQKKKNGYGLFDLSGNVFEWTLDKWHDNYDGAPTDGTAWTSGDSSGRVTRGGCWRFGASYLRVAHRSRSYLPPSFRRDYLGFRIVRNDN
jgi:formylglycine-generating enzyme required for sulfatase activity